MKKTAWGISLISGLLCFGLASVVRADDKAAEAKLQQAGLLYKDRTEAAKVDAALTLLTQAESEAADDQLKYDILTLESKLLYWKGMHTAGDKNKIAIHDQGKNKANAARAILPDLADSCFWSAANLGRWAEAKGVIASLSKKKEIMETLESIFDKNTKAGEAGDTYEGYGADRILGRLYFKLPGFAGGSLATSLKHLEQAYTKAPTVALNVNFYAESLASGNSGQKAKAKQILDDLLAKDPKTLNADRVPETLEEFADARKLRAELGR